MRLSGSLMPRRFPPGFLALRDLDRTPCARTRIRCLSLGEATIRLRREERPLANDMAPIRARQPIAAPV